MEANSWARYQQKVSTEGNVIQDRVDRWKRTGFEKKPETWNRTGFLILLHRRRSFRQQLRRPCHAQRTLLHAVDTAWTGPKTYCSKGRKAKQKKLLKREGKFHVQINTRWQRVHGNVQSLELITCDSVDEQTIVYLSVILSKIEKQSPHRQTDRQTHTHRHTHTHTHTSWNNFKPACKKNPDGCLCIPMS